MLRAQIAIKRGNYIKADSLADRAYLRFSNKKERKGWMYAEYAHSLGYAYTALEEYEKSEELFEKALSAFEPSKKNHRFTTRYSLSLAKIYGKNHKYAEAIEIHNRVLKVSKKQYRKKYHYILNNLAEIYAEIGLYERAIELSNDALQIVTQKKKKKSIISTYNDVAVMYNKMGNNEQAIEFLNKALNVKRKLSCHKQVFYYRNLAVAYHNIEDNEQAIHIIKKALTILENCNKTTHLDVADLYYALGAIYSKTDDDKQAISYFTAAEKILTKKNGDKHPNIVLVYASIAETYYKSKNYKQAIKFYYKALNILEDKYGNNHSDITNYKNRLSVIYQEIGNYRVSDSLYHVVMSQTLSQLNNLYMSIPSKYRSKLSGRFYRNHTSFYSFAVKEGSDSIRELATDIILNSRSLALDYTVSINKIIQRIDDKKLAAQYKRLNLLNKQIVDAQLMTSKELKRSGLNILKIKEEQEYLTFKVLRHPEIKSKLYTEPITWQDIKRGLSENEAAISFLLFHYHPDGSCNPEEPFLYYAVIISKNLSSPQFVRLTNEETLQEYLKLTAGKVPYYLSGDDKLYELYQQVWQPLEPYLKGITKVHLSPSGSLHEVSFESLKQYNIEGDYLAERYKFHYHSALRDILTKKSDTLVYKDIVLGGHIIYDLNPEKVEVYKKNKEEVLNITTANRGSRKGFNHLPKTLNEVVEVDKIAKQSGLISTLLTEDTATEDTVRHFSGDFAPSILHWATHGSFLTAFDTIPDRSLVGSHDFLRASDSPLQRSLLAFYGANHRWEQNERAIYSDDDDGILTALEVTTLDLQKTNLVVISACNSGIGYTENDIEGVFGLQRAFKLAGVDYIIASLWQVDDKATQELMVEFYKNLLELKQDPATALRNAKRKFMKDDPELWAGFILIE